MVGICMVPCMHVVTIIGGRTNHSCCVSNGCSCAYLFILQVVTTSRNLSLQYVNSRICTLKLGWGLASGGAPSIHKMSSLSPEGQVHLCRWHVHGRSHDGMMLLVCGY